MPARALTSGGLYQAPARPAKKYGCGLPKIKRNLPPVPTSLFRFRNNTFTAHWTALRGHTFATYLRLKGARTEIVVDFDLDDVKYGQGGAAIELIFHGLGPHNNLRVVIDARGW